MYCVRNCKTCPLKQVDQNIDQYETLDANLNSEDKNLFMKCRELCMLKKEQGCCYFDNQSRCLWLKNSYAPTFLAQHIPKQPTSNKTYYASSVIDCSRNGKFQYIVYLFLSLFYIYIFIYTQIYILNLPS